MAAKNRVEVTLSGMPQLQRRLQELAAQYGRDAAVALRAEGELIMTEAKKITPVQYGALRASGVVEGPDKDPGGSMSVRMGFGGPSAPYAVYVHENMNARHAAGTQAKFLEQPLLAALKGLAERLAARLRK